MMPLHGVVYEVWDLSCISVARTHKTLYKGIQRSTEKIDQISYNMIQTAETQDMLGKSMQIIKVYLEHFLENSDGSCFTDTPRQVVPDGRSCNC